MIGVSPTYLSKVERDEFAPPAEEKVKAIAKILGRDPDELLALAGRVSSDISETTRGTGGSVAHHERAQGGGYCPLAARGSKSERKEMRITDQ